MFGPAHRFPFASNRRYTPPDATVEDFERLQQRLGLSRAIFVQASCHGTDNRAMMLALQHGRGRYAGVAMVDDSTSQAELERLHEVGVRGTRFNFVDRLGSLPDFDALRRTAARVQRLGWHLVLHFEAKYLPRYADAIRRLEVPFVIDHMARVDAAAGVEHQAFQMLLALAEDKRCWVKISGAERISAEGPPGYADVVPFARALIAAAPDRVLWGTDWPHPNVPHMPDDGDLVDLLAAYAPEDSLRRRILVDNPARLYDFG